MPRSFPTTYTSSWRKVLDTNTSSGTALAGKSGTTTKPSTTGATGVINPNADQCNSLIVIPLHDGTDTNTFNMSIHGYSAYAQPGSDPLYVGGLLVDVLVAVTTLTAVIDGTTFQLPDTITVNKGDGAVHIISPGSNFGASMIVDTYGYSTIEFEFDAVSAGAMNAICRWI